MNKINVGYLQEKGAEIVGCLVRNKDLVGKDIGLEAGLSSELGVKISDFEQADLFFQSLKRRNAAADVAIVATKSTMAELEAPVLACVRNGVNVITIGEEATFPYTTSKEITERIDVAAKKNKVTVFGSGYTDLWVTLPLQLAGSMLSIKSLDGKCQYNVNDYGIALCEFHGVDLSKEEFDEKIGSKANVMPPCYGWNAAEGVASGLGLTVTGRKQEFIPYYADEPIFCSVLNKNIEVGRCTGFAGKATIETKEGITISFASIGRVYKPKEVDDYSWVFHGGIPQKSSINLPAPDIALQTCTITVNRIPQVINNTDYGYKTADRFPFPILLVKPLGEYCNNCKPVTPLQPLTSQYYNYSPLGFQVQAGAPAASIANLNPYPPSYHYYSNLPQSYSAVNGATIQPRSQPQLQPQLQSIPSSTTSYNQQFAIHSNHWQVTVGSKSNQIRT